MNLHWISKILCFKTDVMFRMWIFCFWFKLLRHNIKKSNSPISSLCVAFVQQWFCCLVGVSEVLPNQQLCLNSVILKQRVQLTNISIFMGLLRFDGVQCAFDSYIGVIISRNKVHLILSIVRHINMPRRHKGHLS